VSGGHTLCLVIGGRVIAHTEIQLIGGGGIFTSPIRNCLSVCAYVRVGRICRSDTDRERFSESRVERVAGLAHDCQSRELRSHTTHAGVMTICTVPEMLPETWTRGNETHHTEDEN